jgi:hypothetical protein
MSGVMLAVGEVAASNGNEPLVPMRFEGALYERTKNDSRLWRR